MPIENIKIRRKEPVKSERVQKLTKKSNEKKIKKIEKEVYDHNSPFQKTRILFFNKLEYRLGKGWENMFIRVKRNQEFKENIWPFIYKSYQSKSLTPELKDLFKPFEYCDPMHTKVVFVNKQPSLVVKEDGLAFSTKEIGKKTVLFNELYLEAARDRKIRAVRYYDGSLEKYAEQGVFLYNYILTNVSGETKKHEAIGWDIFSKMVIKELVKEETPKVFVLFGNAVYNSLNEMISKNPKHKIILISSSQKINGSNLFSEINDFLTLNNIEPINWSLGKIRK